MSSARVSHSPTATLAPPRLEQLRLPNVAVREDPDDHSGEGAGPGDLIELPSASKGPRPACLSRRESAKIPWPYADAPSVGHMENPAARAPDSRARWPGRRGATTAISHNLRSRIFVLCTPLVRTSRRVTRYKTVNNVDLCGPRPRPPPTRRARRAMRESPRPPLPLTLSISPRACQSKHATDFLPFTRAAFSAGTSVPLARRTLVSSPASCPPPPSAG